jgi:DnaJ-class molecular chaperone
MGRFPVTFSSPSAAFKAGACPVCLGDGETFHIVLDRIAPCSGCGGTGKLEDMLRRQCSDPNCPDHHGAGDA